MTMKGDYPSSSSVMDILMPLGVWVVYKSMLGLPEDIAGDV